MTKFINPRMSTDSYKIVLYTLRPWRFSQKQGIVAHSIILQHNVAMFLYAYTVHQSSKCITNNSVNRWCNGSDIAAAIGLWLHTGQSHIQSQASSCMIHADKSSSWTNFSMNFFQFLLLIIISPLLHAHTSLPLKMYRGPDQTTHYHSFSL
jgi:uncharacterized SAM-binding protein YcdF (DUF218 family)